MISRVNSICNLMKMQRDGAESSPVGCSCDVSSSPVCVCVCVCVCVSERDRKSSRVAKLLLVLGFKL